jgi:hypothetical protein
MDWRKSTYSGSNGSCVETASGNGVIHVRDTTDHDRLTLSVPADAWQRFTDSISSYAADTLLHRGPALPDIW